MEDTQNIQKTFKYWYSSFRGLCDGMGVNDNDTFAALLEKINKPVYNLAVSGYGTPRELIRLEKSNLIDKVDTIIIQYCYNDYGENKNFRINEEDIAKEKFNIVEKSKPISFLKN